MNNTDKLIGAISSVLGVSMESVSEAISQDDILEWDSLAMVNLIAELEIVFDVQFEIIEIAGFDNIKKIKMALESKGIEFSIS